MSAPVQVSIEVTIACGEFVFAVSPNTRRTQPVTVTLDRFIGQYSGLMSVSTVVARSIIRNFAALQRFIVGELTADRQGLGRSVQSLRTGGQLRRTPRRPITASGHRAPSPSSPAA
ncbi:MAG: hypothetical protein P4M09_10570 [Devosia sp.]|nr:hypothetical protein [Devosia sp.]